ncbi:MAG: hypothetical protein A3K08_00190 [Candidatus Doudnabacteria bacterium RIFCSPLOWO2_01_41_7]|nr:MAG: hypothetical protein A3K08_00190 [Candidatus Doudnabacteria bacterium RIFCSPLOWO2_01_41_7]
MERRKIPEGEFVPREETETLIENQSSKRHRVPKLLGAVKQSLGLKSEIASDLQRPEDIVKEVDQVALVAETSASKSSILHRIRELPATIRGSLAALVLTAEAGAAQSAFQSQEKEYKVIREKGDIPAPMTLRFEGDHVIVEDDELGFFLKHNLKRPESLADVGKMFVEPLSFGIKFRLGKEHALPTRIVTGGSEDEPFVFAADIPYEYAHDFSKASPVDQKKMEEDMEIKAKALIEKILPRVIGLSFHKDEVKNIGRQGSVEVSEVKIDGFASPESDQGIDTNDPRNQTLSEMRADNAAYVLQQVFKDKGIDVSEIKYQGKGEEHLSKEERDKLLNDAFEIKIGPNGPEDPRLLELVKRYNAGSISQEEIKKDLDQIIGEKRKVAVTITTDERSYVLILPLPALLLLLGRIPLPDRDTHGVYAEFTPGPVPSTGDLDRDTRGQARSVGRNIRRDHFDPVRPSRDVVKGYSGTDETQAQYSEQVVRGARHWRKREESQRVQLDFDPSMPLAARVDGLAFVVDRYMRMTPTLMSERNMLGRSRTRDYDLMNIYRDRDALQTLLNRVARTDIDMSGRPANMPPPNIPEHGRVRFEFRSNGRNIRTAGPDRGTQGRRESTYGAYVWINGVEYQLNRQELQTLADTYIANRRIIDNMRH